jgi:integration host factor subunit alpha
VESLLEIIKQTLESGEDVLISGFGKFCLKDKRKRKGGNPQTGQDLLLDEICSELLRGEINGKNVR